MQLFLKHAANTMAGTPSVLFLDLWKTLARGPYPEPILNLQEILNHKTIRTENGHVKTILCPEFLRVCLTTNISDPDRFLEHVTAKTYKDLEGKDVRLTIPPGGYSRFRDLVEAEKLGVTLFPDVQIQLQKLKDDGHKLALLSNVWPFPVPRLLQESQLDEVFEGRIFLSCEIGYAKPERELFLEACRRLNVQPEACLMVGDNASLDIRGALRVGMPAVHIDRLGDIDDFVEGVPVINRLSELYNNI